MTQYEKGYTGANGHKPDEDAIAREWILALRQGIEKSLPPFASILYPHKWSQYIMQLARVYRESHGSLEAVEATISSMLQSPNRWPGFADLLKPKAQPESPPAREDEQEPESIPPLPIEAQLSDDASMGASPWLDDYIAYSQKVSSEGYAGFHEACGLWILSTVAGRRVKIPFRRKQYTPLMLLLVADTTLYAKSETAEVAIEVLQASGLRWMLGSDETTPQKLHSDMVGIVPKDYSSLSEEKQARIERRLAMSGQRGWFYDEFGQLIRSMLKQNGYMAELKGLLLKLDKCADEYSYATQSRGTETIEKPYLALLGCMTPPDIKKEAKSNGPFWTDGLWARFSFVCPPKDSYLDAPFEIGEIPVPYEISRQLSTWHYRLGMPHVDIQMKRDDKGREMGASEIEREPLPETECQFGSNVWEAWVRYRSALKKMIVGMKNRDLAGSYSRLAIRAMRVAALLASLENNGMIEMKHWARAQGIAEGWRRSLHELYAQVNIRDETSPAASLEDEILRHIKRLEVEKELSPSASDLKNYMKSYAVSHIQKACDDLCLAGLLSMKKTAHTKRYGLVHVQAQEQAQKQEDPSWTN